MLKADMLTMLNTCLAGEALTWNLALIHFNWGIDEINATLNTNYPPLKATDPGLTAIPDRYIRTVVIPAAAHHFYIVDEEGACGEVDYNMMYQQGLFRMLRDYSHDIPEQYQDDPLNGTVDSTYGDWAGMRGIWI